jgi:hypothetical protein
MRTARLRVLVSAIKLPLRLHNSFAVQRIFGTCRAKLTTPPRCRRFVFDLATLVQGDAYVCRQSQVCPNNEFG